MPVEIRSPIDIASGAPVGLTTDEAQARLAQFGPNDPAPQHRASLFAQIAPQLLNPLIIILLLASVVAASLGELTNAVIIVIMIALSLTLNTVQTFRSQRAIEQLRRDIAPTATVLRDGVWGEVPRGELVTGDLIRLAAGDLVPADARLLEAVDLHVQEAALTGESLPVEKSATQSPVSDAAPEAANRVFLGTTIVSGTAIARVAATGKQTQFGAIATHLATRAPETEFERGVRRFGYLIMRTVLFLVVFVFLAGIAFRHNPLESLLFAVALAVGLTPEFLPMITTVTLGQGALKMARERVIVKHLPAIQNFGSIDVLCSDKTGTLTQGVMRLNDWLEPFGTPSNQAKLPAYLNSVFESGVASPLEVAIRAIPNADISAYRKVAEIPFDFERRLLSVIVADAAHVTLIAKGAPESVIPRCRSYQTGDRPAPLDPDAIARCVAAYEKLSAQGLRVLAVASRAAPDKPSYGAQDECDLTLLGYVTFLDPPLPDAAETIQMLRADGIDLKILTGDNELVARHVCEQVGLDVSRIITGSDLERMSDSALLPITEQVTVFARVSPTQKNRIILALRNRKHVVGYIGDGVNDAPSLHTADVGISVADAVDVARDAADIILLDRSLRVLHKGIIAGRKAFGNVMKYLLMGTSSNFGNMFSMAAAFAFLPFLPMLPTQILLNNFLYDVAQVTIPTDSVDDTFMRKPRRWDIRLIRNVMIGIGPISSIYDFLTFAVLLGVFHASAALFHTGWFVESLATQTLVLFVIRTTRLPWRSRPSRPLALTVVSVVVIGMLLPYTPLAAPLGFVPLPFLFWVFLVLMTATYLALVELMKRPLMRGLLT